MLVNILLAIGALIVVVLLLATTRPNTFRIERSARINATPEKVFPLLVDFHRWPEWSPWEKLDPNMKRTHAGPISGVGASYAWEGNSKAGQGRMEITSATPPNRLVIALDFIKPFEGHNTTTFTLTPSGSSTGLSWVMEGQNRFMGKVMGLFMNMDKLIGKDFEAGLARIKAVAEG